MRETETGTQRPERCTALDYTDQLERCQLAAGHRCPHASYLSMGPLGAYWWLGGNHASEEPVQGIPKTWPWWESP